MQKIHELKTVNPYFQDVVDGKKTFEVRVNDRKFHTGDFLKLREYWYSTSEFTGRYALVKVTYICRNMSVVDLPSNVVVMSILLLAVGVG